MKDRFIHTAPPSMLILTFIFDIAAMCFLGISVFGVIKSASFFTVGFLIIEIIITVVAALMSREVFKTGARFEKTGVYFTWLDENNTYLYSEIEKAEIHKDTSASLRKGLIERYSSLILQLEGGEVATVEFGITTRGKLRQVEEELNNRIKKEP